MHLAVSLDSLNKQNVENLHLNNIFLKELFLLGITVPTINKKLQEMATFLSTMICHIVELVEQPSMSHFSCH